MTTHPHPDRHRGGRHRRRHRSRLLPGGRVAGERGSSSVELVLLAPVFLVILCLVVGLGRVEEARGRVEGAARDAARAASLARTPAAATAAAEAAAEGNLHDAGLACTAVAVTTDTAAFTPGGTVTATVSCTADLADLALSGLPGATTLSAAAAAPVEAFRGTDAPG